MSPLVLLYPLTFVVSLVNPRWGFIGLLITMLVRPAERLPSLAGFPGFELVLVGLILGMALHLNSLAKPDARQDTLIAWLFCLSILGLLIQARGELVDETKEFISAIIIYVFATRLIRNKSDLLTLFFWLSAVTVGLAVEATHSFLTDPDSPFTDPASGRMQGLGYYGNPNEFGKLMCTAIPLFGIFLFASKSLILRLVALAGIAVMLTAVGLTQSRTCFVAVGIIAVAPFLVSANSGLVKRVVIIGIVGIGLLYVVSLLPGPLQERTQSIMAFNSDESFQGRTRSWGQGLQMVSWYPLYGVGKGQWYAYHGLAPHNSFVQIMAEMGIPGIIVFCMIVWTSWRQLPAYVKSIGKAPDRMMLAISKGIAASYLGYVFYIFLGNQGYSPWTYFYFGICAAFAHVSRPMAEEPAAEGSAASLEVAKSLT
jgi:O-antigen ligase